MAGRRSLRLEEQMIRGNGQSDSELTNGFRLYRQMNRSRGWQAQFRLFGKVYSRYFSDAEYGSSAAARQAAERLALQNQDLHDELRSLHRRFVVRANCRSGLPGVARYDGNKTRRPFWLAYWDDQSGRRVTRRFSVGRYGEEEASRLARKAREKAVRPFRERYEQILAELGRVPEVSKKRRPKRQGILSATGAGSANN